MADGSFLHFFLEDSNYYSWHSKLSDEELIKIYQKAIQAEANEDFIKLLSNEIKRREEPIDIYSFSL
jgi:hypothetical protein